DAAEYLAPFSHVTVIEGDATKEVARLIAEAGVHDALVFLDGHFSGEGTGVGTVADPAVDVLGQLGEHSDAIRSIVIDDFREFGVQPGWPKKWEVIRSAEEIFVPRGFRLRVHLDQLLLERPLHGATLGSSDTRPFVKPV